MKLELILAAALSTAPTLPEEQPMRTLFKQGDVIACNMPGGCYVANAQGIGQLVREISAQVSEQLGCKRRPSL